MNSCIHRFLFSTVLVVAMVLPSALHAQTSAVILEDGEDGLTQGWSKESGVCGETPIENIQSDASHGRTIRLCGSDTSVRYDFFGDPGAPWGMAEYDGISWDMKTASHFIFYIVVNTSEGPKALRYTDKLPLQAVSAQEFIHLGDYAADGMWHTFRRDLVLDLNKLSDTAVFQGIAKIMVRGGMELDNITVGSNVNQPYVSGLIKDKNATPVSYAKILLVGENGSYIAYSDASGRYAFTSLGPQVYTLVPSVEGKPFGSVSFSASDASPENIIDLQESTSPQLTLEDAEDGDTTGWINVYPGASGSALANVAGETGRTVRLGGQNTATRYDFIGNQSTPWGSVDYPFIAWDMKTTTPYIFYVIADTALGLKAVRYTGRLASRASAAKEFVHLGEYSMDGNWHTFRRSVASDLRALYGETVEFRGVKKIMVRGGMELDNIMLSKSGPNGFIVEDLVGGTGQPLVEATVTVTNGTMTLMDYSDENGMVVFTSLESGEYTRKVVLPRNVVADQIFMVSDGNGGSGDNGGSEDLTELERNRIVAACDYANSPIAPGDWYGDEHIHVTPDHRPAEFMEAMHDNGIETAVMWPGHMGNGDETGILESSHRLDRLFLQAAQLCSRLKWAVMVYPDVAGQVSHLEAMKSQFPGAIGAIAVDVQHGTRDISNDITSAEMTGVLDFARDNNLSVHVHLSLAAALAIDPNTTLEQDFLARLQQYPTVPFVLFGGVSPEGGLGQHNLFFNRNVGNPTVAFIFTEIDNYVRALPADRENLELHRTVLGIDASLPHAGDENNPGLTPGAERARQQIVEVAAMEQQAINNLRAELEQSLAAEGKTQEEIAAIISSDPRMEPVLEERLRRGLLQQVLNP